MDYSYETRKCKILSLLNHNFFSSPFQALPQYTLAHERAVYKAVSIVADTKKIVKELNIASLGELRAMQKPDVDIEDLMAAIIMICKYSGFCLKL